MIARKTKGVNPVIEALGTFLEQVIEWSIVGGTEKWIALHFHEASHGKTYQDSKAVVDEPPSEPSEKECQIDLKKKITLIIQTSKPDAFSIVVDATRVEIFD